LEIDGMIQLLQAGTKESVELVQEGGEVVAKTVELTQQASQSLTNIISSITSISDSNILVASAAEEQSSISKEISANVSEIDNVIGRIVEGSRETSSSADNLSAVSSELQGLIRQFKI